MPASSLILAALCAMPLSPLPSQPALHIGLVGANLESRIAGCDQIFLGGVIASLSPQQTHYLTGLPPLLTDHVVLGVGVGYPDGGFAVSLPQSLLPPGLQIYAQGVTLIKNLAASEVVSFVMPTVAN